MAEKKQYPLRIDPQIWKALEKWSGDELRSVNAQVEFLLRKALKDAGRLPKDQKGRI
ncbi:MAG: Arc family DNA binding domain-containing protein [Coriobacteriales bacterium]|nr:Arc family DNA binding domain-containing protein [Coriobacteriales bacterium]